ncbi:transcriptional regulator [Paraburkholderia sp. Cy-641]|uniref:ParB/RepB/Spo0J family partition protein n=1 Tax=Paraburkholderia sp. Cy-641 TaxID=2608337 RepID=UPI0031F5D3D1
MLDAMLVTGNTKAAIAQAGGKSGDLWKVPPHQINYDPRDNARPLNPTRVRHLADLIKANGFDRKSPLGCYVRKVAGEDRVFVYSGQHRYHAALMAMDEGAEIDFLPCVIDEAKSVNRANLIFDGINANDTEQLTPLDLAQNVVELQQLDVDNATICKRLNITEQTIRDVLLLANAPAPLHKLVRDKVVASTLAIEEIRAHGPEKALERLQNAAQQAEAAGKTKVTRKALPKPASQKITDVQAKQLLQALQAVLHDAGFGKLATRTIEGVHTALMPLTDLLDRPPKRATIAADIAGPEDVIFVDELQDMEPYPLHHTNENGVFERCERIAMPTPAKHRGLCPAEIMLAHPEEGSWIFANSFSLSKVGEGSWPSLCRSVIYSSRFKALQAARDQLIERLSRADVRTDKMRPAILKWLDDVYIAEHAKLDRLARARKAPAAGQRKESAIPPGLSPKAAWPFPSSRRDQ